jgi:hypothetical protein
MPAGEMGVGGGQRWRRSRRGWRSRSSIRIIYHSSPSGLALAIGQATARAKRSAPHWHSARQCPSFTADQYSHDSDAAAVEAAEIVGRAIEGT